MERDREGDYHIPGHGSGGYGHNTEANAAVVLGLR